jgi:F0F1-type ATP synthase delta subunit
MVNKIYIWIKNNTESEKIIDIKVDKEIIAGARITYKGNFADFTLNKKWEEVWNVIKNKSVIIMGDN